VRAFWMLILALRILMLLVSGAALHPPCRPLLSQSWAEVVCHSSLRAEVPPRPSPKGYEEFSVNAGLDSLF
jgi:hypothetical protein